MREYGFRVYNPRDKKMHYDITGFEFLDSSNMSGVFIDGGFYLKEEVYIMQCTGLHDKNGKEIYEGDIVQVDNIDLAQIIYDEDRLSWGIKPINEFYFDSPLLADNVSLELKVIGNIYENSDLLKGEN